MKKILIALLVLLVASLGVLSVSATEGFRVDITGDAVVTAGSTVEYKVEVNAITVEGGLIGGDLHITYDPEFFSVESVTGATLEGWNMDSNKNTAGTIKLYPAQANADPAGAVTADGAISYVIKLKVLEQSEKLTSTLTVSYASGNDVSFNAVDNAAKGSLNVTLRQKLASPADLVWEDSVAKWSAVENASGYSVQAYKAGKAMGEAQIAEGTSFDFKTLLTEGGKYTFTVIAVSDQPEYEDSAESAQSSAFYTVVGTLAAPKIKLTQNVADGGFDFIITDTNPDGTVSGYVVTLYKKGSDTAAVTVELAGKDGEIPCDGTKVVGGESYVATVMAISKDTELNNNSAASSKTEAVVALEKVVSLQFKAAPKLSYVEGDKLDLSDMVVTIVYESGATKDVAFKNFEKNGLTVNMKDGKELVLSDAGKAITVSYGSSASATTASLIVESGVCEHPETTTQRQEPTCGADGREIVTCQECGATVADNVLEATGQHTYGEWSVFAEPQENVKGLKERFCSACNHRDTEEIAATGATTPPPTTPVQTDDPDDTTEDTEPDDGNDVYDEPSPMNDMTRIFLIIVIVVFTIIVLFIVGAICLESSRRKARSRNRRSSSGNAPRRRR